MVTTESALMLAQLHRERDDTAKLITECEEDARKCKDDDRWISRDLRDPPHKKKGRWLEVHFPSGENGWRPRMVDPALGLAILRAHAADIDARIISINEIIRLELNMPAPPQACA